MSGVEFFLFAVFMAPVLFWMTRATRPKPPVWSMAAEDSRLTMIDRSTWTTGDAPDRGLRVRFEELFSGDQVGGTRILIDALDHGIVTLSLAPETEATARAKQRGAREIETGDEAFDEQFYLTGPVAAVRAVLDGGTRSLLLALRIEAALEVVQGELRAPIEYPSHPGDFHESYLSRTLPRLIAAAVRLRRPADVAAALIHNAVADQVPGVRRENLLSLARNYPDAPGTRETLRKAMSDTSDDVRVRAAIVLAEEGRRTLLEVARNQEADAAAAARAITALADHLPKEDAGVLLRHALRARRLETAHACLSRLGHCADASVIPQIARVLSVEKGDLAVAAARALAATGVAEAEAPLLAALSRDPPAIRVAAAEALGRVASAAAVLPLKQLEAGDHDEATRRAARQAVAAIQSRLPGASPGQLSLAAPDTGGLSLAEDETGRLSLDGNRKQ